MSTHCTDKNIYIFYIFFLLLTNNASFLSISFEIVYFVPLSMEFLVDKEKKGRKRWKKKHKDVTSHDSVCTLQEALLITMSLLRPKIAQAGFSDRDSWHIPRREWVSLLKFIIFKKKRDENCALSELKVERTECQHSSIFGFSTSWSLHLQCGCNQFHFRWRENSCRVGFTESLRFSWVTYMHVLMYVF